MFSNQDFVVFVFYFVGVIWVLFAGWKYGSIPVWEGFELEGELKGILPEVSSFAYRHQEESSKPHTC